MSDFYDDVLVSEPEDQDQYEWEQLQYEAAREDAYWDYMYAQEEYDNMCNAYEQMTPEEQDYHYADMTEAQRDMLAARAYYEDTLY